MILDSRHLEKTTLATVAITTSSSGCFEEVSGTGSVFVMVEEASLKEDLVSNGNDDSIEEPKAAEAIVSTTTSPNTL